MRAGLIIIGLIIIMGVWFITNTQIAKTLPMVGPLTGRVAALPSIEIVAYVVGGLVLLMGIFLTKKVKTKIEAQEEDEEEEESEEEPEEEPEIEEINYCTNCGAEVEGRFCSQCGKKVRQKER